MSQPEVININSSGSNVHEALDSQSAVKTSEQEQSELAGESETLDITIERRRLISILKHYKARFPDHVPFNDINHLEDLDPESLEKLFNETKYAVSVRNTMKYSDKMFAMGLTCFEQLAVTFTPLKMQGLSELAVKDKELMDTAHELMLEMSDMIYVHPGYRLCYQLMMTAFTVHTINSLKEAMSKGGQARQEGNIPSDVKSRFDSL